MPVNQSIYRHLNGIVFPWVGLQGFEPWTR